MDEDDGRNVYRGGGMPLGIGITQLCGYLDRRGECHVNMVLTRRKVDKFRVGSIAVK